MLVLLYVQKKQVIYLLIIIADNYFIIITDTPDELETPTDVSVQPSRTEALVTLIQANCSLIKGNIEYYISARCTNEWCKNMTTISKNTNYYFSKKKISITGLLPYSTYIMDIKLGRTNGDLSKDELSTQFNTLSAGTYKYGLSKVRTRCMRKWGSRKP